MERKLAAILSADVKGYSRLMGEDDEATVRTLTAHREVMATFIQQHHGRVVDSPGDNLLAEFTSVVEAVRCAVEIQHELKATNAELPDHRKMEFRIGINLGDVIVEGERLYGDGVNIAARLEGLAEAGGICISGSVYEQVKAKVAVEYEYLGEREVKNIAEPVRVWRVRLDEATAAGDAGSPKSEVRSPESKKESPKPRRVGMPVFVLVSVLLLGGIVILLYPSLPTFIIHHSSLIIQEAQPPLLPFPDKPSIVVLPFVNMSKDPEQEYFSDGLTEDLTSDLTRISSLFVIARNSAFTYKGKAVKVQDVSREMGVRYVLEGSVRKAGDQLRITAQLVDGTTGGHVWSERYDRLLHDIFALQDEITQRIVTVLRVEMQEAELERVQRLPTENLTAYDSLLRGVEYYLRSTKEANAQARQLFERAIELDPRYATAYAALGWTHFTDWGLQWSQDPQSLERASELAHKAIVLDDSLPQAHMLLSFVYQLKNQLEPAITEAKRAIALDPNGADSYAALAEALSWTVQSEEAIALAEKAMRLNPRYPVYYLMSLGRAYAVAGRTEEAITALKSALARNRDFLPPHVLLVFLYTESGREEEAHAEVAEVLRISPNFSVDGLGQRAPYPDQVLARYLAALRKAGLK
jgi:adenylate cyclase